MIRARQQVWLVVLLAATAVLYLWNLGASGWANAFYSAAAQAGATTAVASQHTAGLELLVLAAGLGARRDFPTLDSARALADVRREHPALDVDGALERVDAMTLAERTTRLGVVVRSLRPLFV